MATVDRESEKRAGTDVATRLSTAPFVRIVARADGDGVAAAGTVARALAASGVPFQVATGRTAADRVARAEVDADGETLLVGATPTPGDALELPDATAGAPLSARAWRVADALLDGRAERSRVATLSLAGAVAASVTPGTAGTASVLEVVDLDRRPGVATPTTPVDGLAHSTLVHGPFSGSPERARETLGPVAETPADEEAAREFASAVTLATLNTEGATAAAAAVAPSVFNVASVTAEANSRAASSSAGVSATGPSVSRARSGDPENGPCTSVECASPSTGVVGVATPGRRSRSTTSSTDAVPAVPGVTLAATAPASDSVATRDRSARPSSNASATRQARADSGAPAVASGSSSASPGVGVAPTSSVSPSASTSARATRSAAVRPVATWNGTPLAASARATVPAAATPSPSARATIRTNGAVDSRVATSVPARFSLSRSTVAISPATRGRCRTST